MGSGEAQAIKKLAEDEIVASQPDFERVKILEAQKAIKKMDSGSEFLPEIAHSKISELKSLLRDIDELKKAYISQNEMIKISSVF